MIYNNKLTQLYNNTITLEQILWIAYVPLFLHSKTKLIIIGFYYQLAVAQIKLVAIQKPKAGVIGAINLCKFSSKFPQISKNEQYEANK